MVAVFIHEAEDYKGKVERHGEVTIPIGNECFPFQVSSQEGQEVMEINLFKS